MTTCLLSVILLGFALAMDAFSVCVGFGVCYRKANFWSAIRLAVVTALFQALMPLIGWFGGHAIGKSMEKISPVIACVLLFIVGLKMIIEAFEVKEDCDIYDISKGKDLFIVAIATSIDALAAGITIGILRVPLIISVSIIGVITLILSFSGVFIGKLVGNFMGKWSEITGGLIIIGIGLHILFKAFF